MLAPLDMFLVVTSIRILFQIDVRNATICVDIKLGNINFLMINNKNLLTLMIIPIFLKQ